VRCLASDGWLAAGMRVGIDGKCLLGPHGGVGRYLEGLLAGCEAVSHADLDKVPGSCR